MLKNQNSGQNLATTSYGLAFIGIPLWLLSYVWIPFRFAGRETDAVWSFVVASELGAMAAGILSIASGLIAQWYVERGTQNFHRAKRAITLGAIVCLCIVLFNLIGIFFFS